MPLRRLIKVIIIALVSAGWVHGVPTYNSIFGVNILHSECCVSTPDLTPLPPLVGTTWRIWDNGMTWADINTSNGVFNFSGTGFDAYVAAAAVANVDLIYTIAKTPAWASSNATGACSGWSTGQCYPPTSYTTLSAFLTAITAEAAGRIKYWECWNEPDNTGEWQGTVAQMVTFCENVYNALKAINPNFVVLAPPTNTQWWMQEYLAAGGGAYADINTVHAYPTETVAEAEQAVQYGQGYAALSAAYMSNAPLWDTESSWSGNTNLATTALQAAYTAKMYLLAPSSGFSRRYFYAYDPNSTTFASLWNNPGLASPGITPAGIAYQQVQKWMLGTTITSPVTRTIANNAITNPTMTGCVPGTPGTYPTGWSTFGDGNGNNGMTESIVTCGNGYFDVHISGTATVTSSEGWYPPPAVATPASANQQWTYVQPLQLTAGSIANTTTIATYTEFEPSFTYVQYPFEPVSAEQTTTVWAIAPVNTTAAYPQIEVQYNASAAVNLTLRFFTPTFDDGTQWSGAFTRPGGYEAEAIWDQNPTGGATITAPVWATQYHDVTGALTIVTGGSTQVTLTRSPILFENKSAF